MLRLLFSGLMLYMAGCAPGLVPERQEPTQGPRTRSSTIDLSLLSGNWEGGIKGSASTYTIKVSINSRAIVGEVVAMVEYPSIGCGGNWKLKGVSASAYIFAESILQGLTTCWPEGVVELVYIPAQDSLEYSWRVLGSGSGEKGVLRRVK
jgi:hypothetical protein